MYVKEPQSRVMKEVSLTTLNMDYAKYCGWLDDCNSPGIG